MRKSSAVALATLALACLAALPAARAQSYPTKPMRVVIPYPPGGVDVTIRLMLPAIEKELGQPWIIDYRPGAGGIIGMDHVAHSDPDGYTLLATASNPWVVSPAILKHVPYDAIKDFTPISIVIEGVNLIVANPKFPPNNVREMLDYARSHPGKAAWATSGLGSSWHLDGEKIKQLAGVDILHAPFQGFGPMIPAMLSGQVQMGLITYQIINPMVRSGKLKIIGILNTNAKVKPLLPPGIQTVKEVLPKFESGASWIGVGGPAGLPRPMVMRQNAAIIKAINQPALQERFTRDKIVATGSTPEEFAQRIAHDLAQSRETVKETKIPLLD
jgi:tripartite-type tricarboxylate transporter receptor subunit TctC